MQVRIEVVPWLTQAFGYRGAGQLATEQTMPSGATLADLLSALIEAHPEFGEYALDGGAPVCPHVCLTLNGEVVAIPNELGRVLRDGDVLVLLPQFAGG